MRPNVARTLREALAVDADFLRSHNVMDYSLLLGVHRQRYHLQVEPVSSDASVKQGSRRLSVVPPFSHSGQVSTPSGGRTLHSVLGAQARSVSDSGGIISEGMENVTSCVESKTEQPQRKLSLVAHDPDFHSTRDMEAAGDVDIGTDDIGVFHRDDGGMAALLVEGPGLYFAGIIDVLQEYNIWKRTERWFKSFVRCLDQNGISVMPPDGYASRFLERVAYEVIVVDDDGMEAGKEAIETALPIRTGAVGSQLDDLEKEDGL